MTIERTEAADPSTPDFPDDPETPDETDEPETPEIPEIRDGADIEAQLRDAIAQGDSELISILTLELLNNLIAPEEPARYRLKEPQLSHFPPGWSFGGLPANWFRTMAGALLSEARRNLQLTQRDFAALLRIAPSAISRIENGRQDPSIGNLVGYLERGGYLLRVTLEPIKGH
jgi:hypothetical protein